LVKFPNKPDLETNLRKLAKEIIEYILELSGGAVFSKTKLVKLLYLLDYKLFREKGTTLTGLRFKSYFYGPYTEEIDSLLDELVREGKIRIEQREALFEPVVYYEIRLLKKPTYRKLTDDLRQEIERILRPYIPLSLRDILDEVYETEPFINTDFGEEINFAKVSVQR